MSGYFCAECRTEAAGACPSGQRKHRQCPCCALCVRDDGARRSCGGNQRELRARRLAHDSRVPRGPVNA
jgi:hypothetical protein